MELVTLDTLPLDTVVATFNAAFADYAVPIVLDRERFLTMQLRRGFRAELSVGAMEEGRLVGISLTGFGTWSGGLAAYGSGTGVIPAARNRGLAGLMMEKALDLSRGRGAERYVLEVMCRNDPARRAYERVGFAIARTLECWVVDALADAAGLEIEVREGFFPPPPGLCSWPPSWQNSEESLFRTRERIVTLSASSGGLPAAHAALCPETGDFPQFAVAPQLRRQGIGRALVGRARGLSRMPLRIINTEAGHEATSRFLQAIGGTRTLPQFEMLHVAG
jgi:ribosomal protein S18 acetylase RimI-like enzyme